MYFKESWRSGSWILAQRGAQKSAPRRLGSVLESFEASWGVLKTRRSASEVSGGARRASGLRPVGILEAPPHPPWSLSPPIPPPSLPHPPQPRPSPRVLFLHMGGCRKVALATTMQPFGNQNWVHWYLKLIPSSPPESIFHTLVVAEGLAWQAQGNLLATTIGHISICSLSPPNPPSSPSPPAPGIHFLNLGGCRKIALVVASQPQGVHFLNLGGC